MEVFGRMTRCHQKMKEYTSIFLFHGGCARTLQQKSLEVNTLDRLPTCFSHESAEGWTLGLYTGFCHHDFWVVPTLFSCVTARLAAEMAPPLSEPGP